MPKSPRISRNMIVEAAFDLVRTDGAAALNARAVAARLGCSTQPVLYSFKTMDEIREAAYEIADKYHTAYIMPEDTDENPMLALGLNYVRFGQEEKNLFRFLFQTDKFGGKDVAALMADPGLSEILGIMAAGLKADPEQAREMFLTFFCVAHGMASLLANNSMAFDEGQCKKMLENVFFGMIAAGKGA